VYYLALVRSLYMRSALELQVAGGSPPEEQLLGTAVFACVAVTLGTFVAVGPVADVARHATAFLPF
jgi:hypothetical protein